MRQYVKRLVAPMLVIAAALSTALPADASRPLLRDEPRSAAALEPVDPLRRNFPNEAEIRTLVDEVLTLFLQAVATRNMAPLRAEATINLQRQLSVADITETFRPFFDVGLEPDFIAGIAPTITSQRAVGADGLVLEGHYTTDPQTLTFRLSFVREGFAWRWSFLHVALLPPGGKPSD